MEDNAHRYSGNEKNDVFSIESGSRAFSGSLGREINWIKSDGILTETFSLLSPTLGETRLTRQSLLNLHLSGCRVYREILDYVL